MRDAAVAIALFVSLLPNQQAVFRSQTEEVRIDVLVTDGRRPVGGLTARNFEPLNVHIGGQLSLTLDHSLSHGLSHVGSVSVGSCRAIKGL